jgi:hypothetical protein
MAFFALTFLDNVLQTARTVMMNHDLANQMIEDIRCKANMSYHIHCFPPFS